MYSKVNRLKGVLFDLDGTLIDTTNLILESYRHTIRKYFGYTPSDEDLLPGFGTPLRTQLARFSTTQLEDLFNTYQDFNVTNHDRLTTPFPGVNETLAELRKRGYRMGIITSKTRKLTIMGLSLFDLGEFMDVIITADDTTKHKPDPEPVEVGLQALGLATNEALYVGDSAHDVAAGKAAGLVTVAALWGPFPKEILQASGPDHSLNSIDEILDLCPHIDNVIIKQ